MIPHNVYSESSSSYREAAVMREQTRLVELDWPYQMDLRMQFLR